MTIMNVILQFLQRRFSESVSLAEEDADTDSKPDEFLPKGQHIASQMAVWAANGKSVNELYTRADTFGKFILQCNDEQELEIAIDEYIWDIGRMKIIPRWVRTDIIYNIEKYLSSPEISELYGDIINLADEKAELVVWTLVEQYDAVDDIKRSAMREKFSDEILELLDQYYAHVAICQKRQAFFERLYWRIEKLRNKNGI